VPLGGEPSNPFRTVCATVVAESQPRWCKPRAAMPSVRSPWNRAELTGINGARTWCGHGVFAHNLVMIGALAA
jgi:hypothetical protein